MAFPTIIDVTEGVQTSDSTTWTGTYPTLAADDLLLCIMGVDGNPSLTSITDGLTPAWITATPNGFDAGTAARLLLGKKHARGDETGNFTITLGTAEQGCWKCISVRGWPFTRYSASAPPIGLHFVNSDANGGGATCQPEFSGTDASGETTNQGPYGVGSASEEILYLQTIVVDGAVTITTGLGANYSTVGTFQSSGGANGAGLAVQSRQNLGVADNPGTSWALSGAEDWATGVVMVRPNIDPTSAQGVGRGPQAQQALVDLYRR